MNQPKKDAINVLDKIKKINELSNKEIRCVDFSGQIRQITVKQQKDLIKSAVDSPITKFLFNITTSKILKENLILNNGNVDELTIFSKVYALCHIRKNTFGHFYYRKKEGEATEEIDLDKLVFYRPEISLTGIYDYNNITVFCKIPTVGSELSILESVYDKNESIDVRTSEDIRNILSTVYMVELLKCVDDVSIDGESIDFKSYSVADRFKIIESFNAELNDNIIKFSTEYKTNIDNYIKYNDKPFEIDASFFIS